jgi:2-phospho-L-lactate/phosphoenolpyruvate guanylyltransferase
MAVLVVPFRGQDAKSRLATAPVARRALGLAMLGDVLAACVAVGETRLASSDAEARAAATSLGCLVADDPGGGQGAAVASALPTAQSGALAVVNADLPCVTPSDLEALLAAAPGALALVEARDGTTNALAFPTRAAFAPLYGPGSAARFRAHADGHGLGVVTVALPNLVDDVDTLADLRGLQPRVGPRTRAVLASLEEPVAL